MRSLLWSSPWKRRGVGAVLGVVLLIAMILNTKFLGKGASADAKQANFNPATYAEQQFPKLAAAITDKAVDVATLAAAVDASPTAAGAKYGQDLGAGSFAFAVKASGAVSAVDANFITVTVNGMPAGDQVRVPVGLALSGSPIRDSTGLIHFGDFRDQTDYQDVANALKTVVQKQVLAKVDPASLVGKNISVVGAFATGGPPKTFSIIPVSLEATP